MVESHKVYVHYLSGGPNDGEKVPNYRPWETLVITAYCQAHKRVFDLDICEKCPDCKKHKYVKFESDEFQEVDYPGLEVITKDNVDQAPIMHRVDMRYEGQE